MLSSLIMGVALWTSLLQPASDMPFNFRSLQATPQSLDWQVQNEQRFGQFFVQVKRVHTWVSFKVVNCKGKAGTVSYSIPISPTEGRNHFRIKYLDVSGSSYYSPEVCYVGSK